MQPIDTYYVILLSYISKRLEIFLLEFNFDIFTFKKIYIHIFTLSTQLNRLVNKWYFVFFFFLNIDISCY